MRTLSLCLMLLIALIASAQRPQITDRLNKNGQVTVDAPKELVKRNNADLNGKQTNNKDKKVKEKDKKKNDPANEEERLNELDDDNKDTAKKDEEKKKEDEKKKEELTPKSPSALTPHSRPSSQEEWDTASKPTATTTTPPPRPQPKSAPATSR